MENGVVAIVLRIEPSLPIDVGGPIETVKIRAEEPIQVDPFPLGADGSHSLLKIQALPSLYRGGNKQRLAIRRAERSFVTSRLLAVHPSGIGSAKA